MELNWPVIFLSAIVPLMTGFIWYHPKVFGNAWLKSGELDPEKLKRGNMTLVFLLTYILSFFVAMALQSAVIHQYHIYSILANDRGMVDAGTESGKFLKEFLDKYGSNYRTFRHGFFHGFLVGLFLILPVIAINSMFERKKWKFIWINAGYWTISLALMGGLLCALV
jgi:hypothetical protein